MKKLTPKLLTLLALFGSTLAGSATIVINQTNWPVGDMVAIDDPTNYNLPYSTYWVCGTAACESGVGGALQISNNPTSTTAWAYFADTNNPVQVAVGQQVRMTANIQFITPGLTNGNRYLRFALLYAGTLQTSTNHGTPRNDHLVGYGQNMNFGTTWGLTGPLQTFANTNVVDGQGVIAKGTEQDTTMGPNGGGSYGDPGFLDSSNYTLLFAIAHPDTNITAITTTWYGPGLTNGGAITQTVTDTNYAYTNFDMFVIRPNASSATCAFMQFSSFKVETLPIVPAAPQITKITRLNAGTNVITWNASVGYSYSVLKTNALGTATAPTSSWPVVATGYPFAGSLGTSLSWTDTTATASSSFYRISSP